MAPPLLTRLSVQPSTTASFLLASVLAGVAAIEPVVSGAALAVRSLSCIFSWASPILATRIAVSSCDFSILSRRSPNLLICAVRVLPVRSRSAFRPLTSAVTRATASRSGAVSSMTAAFVSWCCGGATACPSARVASDPPAAPHTAATAITAAIAVIRRRRRLARAPCLRAKVSSSANDGPVDASGRSGHRIMMLEAGRAVPDLPASIGP